ncbi:helix-turn-helix domain-containing protein [Hydrogenophaga palleronii]|jgi:AraC family transcriptional activator of pobA|uniref:helix-turn-helix domain-containing protein n=1 Tax=Hydrogenophaga palleronii TaxID=65655 RepID=UPI000825BA48|nr:helix-turn-helix domain-containing protein [Hydrogenophaga palleronii]
MKTIPRFELYGADSLAPAWAGLVHHEVIPERSSLFGWEIEPHVHEALIQVLYLTHGGGTAVMDGARWVLRPPCVVLSPAQSVHGFSFHPDADGPVVTAAQTPLESIAAVAAPELLRYIRTPAVLEVDPRSRHAEALASLYASIGREAKMHTAGESGSGMPLLLALMVQLARISENGGSQREHERSRKAAQIERFRMLLDERFKQRWPVANYADELGVTPGQLGRLCRDVLGMSPLDVINARVVHEAQRQLVYSTLSIKQIAAELGFADEAYFGRLFKKQTGHQPTLFRTQAQRELARGSGLKG